MSRSLRACDATSRSFMYSSACTEPPRSRTRPSSSSAPVARSSVRPSMAFDPSNRSSCSRRSVSYARICWARSDHCWSQALGSPRASFQAGSWTARARASLDIVTASISSRIRYTLFSGCIAVSPSELTCTPYRNLRNLGSSTPYRSRVMRSHSRANARILHISSTKRIPALQKNEIRPTSRGSSSPGTCPDSRHASSTATPLASVYATSSTGSAPASWRWYEHTLMGFHFGVARSAYAMRSTVSRMLGLGGNT